MNNYFQLPLYFPILLDIQKNLNRQRTALNPPPQGDLVKMVFKEFNN
jgi:hypothetical protein